MGPSLLKALATTDDKNIPETTRRAAAKTLEISKQIRTARANNPPHIDPHGLPTHEPVTATHPHLGTQIHLPNKVYL